MCENKGLRRMCGPKREEDGEHYIMDSIFLCPCTSIIKYYAMKMYGEWMYSCTIFIKVNGQFHAAAALPPRKS
jgi:hypothetical protein